MNKLVVLVVEAPGWQDTKEDSVETDDDLSNAASGDGSTARTVNLFIRGP